jgi:hypothetical protein
MPHCDFVGETVTVNPKPPLVMPALNAINPTCVLSNNGQIDIPGTNPNLYVLFLLVVFVWRRLYCARPSL